MADEQIPSAPPPPPPPPIPVIAKSIGKTKNVQRSTSVDVKWSELRPNQKVKSNEKDIIRIVFISDTHNEHRSLTIPDGDLLIHCGDFTYKRDWNPNSPAPPALSDFNEWLGTLPHKHKIVVSGNHECGFNEMKYEEIQKSLSNAIYLQDNSVSLFQNRLKLFGSPWTSSQNMAFSCPKKDLGQKWDLIEQDTDILITHSPPFNILDLAFVGRKDALKTECDVCGNVHPSKSHWGSDALLSRIQRINPLVHCFGHVHDDCGSLVQAQTVFINAACALSHTATYIDFDLNYCKEHESGKFVRSRKGTMSGDPNSNQNNDRCDVM